MININELKIGEWVVVDGEYAERKYKGHTGYVEEVEADEEIVGVIFPRVDIDKVIYFYIEDLSSCEDISLTDWQESELVNLALDLRQFDLIKQ